MVTIKGGGKLAGYLNRIANKIQATPKEQVGFMEDATYEGSDSSEPNIPVAMVAFINEYGATIKVKEHDQNIYRSINEQTGEFNKKGKFVKKKDSNFMTTHHVKAHTITIPQRPFFRKAISKNKEGWGSDLGKFLKESNYEADTALEQLGEVIQGQVQDSILEFTDPKNADSTIAKKGFDSPLRDTGHMYRSVDHRLKK